MNLLEIAAPFEVSKRLLIEYQSMVYGFSIVEPNCSVKMLKMSVKSGKSTLQDHNIMLAAL